MKCEICGKETNDSALIYQADLVGSQTSIDKSSNIFVDTTTTAVVKTYANVVKCNLYCCKKCRDEHGLWLALLGGTIIAAVLTALFWWGGPWNEHPDGGLWTILHIICVLGVIVFGFLTTFAFIYTIVKLIYPYASVESTLITHLNKPENNKGHKWLTKAEGDKLKIKL
ncbi:MAG: hypothetical protein LBT27_06500 [Prevotellaceae bacterium]|jgi:Na+/phosphate symporter|nr:hypothetical protein [Prevotellaceae bacterium]